MVTRRAFNLGLAATAAGAAVPCAGFAQGYRGPNVILIRFGGGVRRAETIAEGSTYAPYLTGVLAGRGVLIPDVTIDRIEGGNTSHAEGTLNLLTGRYQAYRDAGSGLLDDRLEPTEPTMFEYLRAQFGLAPHEVLLINGEDRPQEEFFTYGIHGHYGVDFKSEMLSLHRFKLYKTARLLEEGGQTEDARARAEREMAGLLAADRRAIPPAQSAPVEAFWEKWRRHFGDTGLKNARGDRLLTQLTLWALRELRPRFVMVNYQDPDYVHWGNASHYTRAITVIDDGIRQIVEAADRDPAYAGNTVFVITPDCGRDANALMDVPFQHHFNSRAAHEVWALVLGAGIARGRVYDRRFDQVDIAATVAALMGLDADRAEGTPIAGLSA